MYISCLYVFVVLPVDICLCYYYVYDLKSFPTSRLLPTTFNVQHCSMSQVLPFDIIALIIDIIARENKDPKLFSIWVGLQVTVTDPIHHLASSKKAFVKLLKGRRTVVDSIHKLIYEVSHSNNERRPHLLSRNLSNFFPTIFSSQRPHNHRFASGLEYNGLFS